MTFSLGKFVTERCKAIHGLAQTLLYAQRAAQERGRS